jgi:hypothetical protein
VKYDFIEIGTCDFDSLCQTCEDWQVGLSIEAIQYYLDRLPNRTNVRKINAVISDVVGQELIYTVPDHVVERYDLPWWVRGCSKIGAPHESVLEELSHKNIEHLYEIYEVKTTTIEQIFQKYFVTEIGLFKTDIEGKDIDVINSLLDYGKVLPNRILFESHPNENQEKFVALDQRLEKLGYSKIEEALSNHLYEKKIKICVVAMYDERYDEIIKTTVNKNFSKYCSFHGYDLVVKKLVDGGRAAQWKKINVLRELLSEGKSDWYFFIDADCLFMNMSRRIEDFIDHKYFLILPKGGGAPDFKLSPEPDSNNLMSSQMLIKNCSESKDFLKEIWEAPDWPEGISLEEFDHEMRQIRISAEKENWKSGIKRLDEKLFNRFWAVSSPFMSIAHPHMNQNIWVPGDYIVHVTGYPLDERNMIIKDLETFSGGLIAQWNNEGSKYFFRPLKDFDSLKIYVYKNDGSFVICYDFENVLRELIYWIRFEEFERDEIYFRVYDSAGKEIGLQKF